MSIELDEISGIMAGAAVRPDLSELLDFYRPSWQRDALCKEHPELNWFPGTGKPTAPAKKVCTSCLVRAECLAYAFEHELVGVWGGTSPRQRAQAIRQGMSATALLAMLTASDAA